MNSDITKKIKEKQQFAEQMEITPYPIVKKNLDEAAAATAKQAAAGLVKMFKSLGERMQ